MKVLTYMSLQVHRMASFEKILRCLIALLSPMHLIIYSGILIEININLSSLEGFLKIYIFLLFENQDIFPYSVFWHFLHSL